MESHSLDEKPTKDGPNVQAASIQSGDDAAQDYLRHHEIGVVEELSSNKSLRWKIDLRIMPLLMTIYFLQYLDKTLLNYAAVMGIKDYLKGNEYNNLGTM